MLRALPFALALCAPLTSLAGAPADPGAHERDESVERHAGAEGPELAASADRSTRATTPGAHARIQVNAKSSSSGQALKSAALLLSCECLDDARVATTDERGLAEFGELPPGEYSLQIFAGEAKAQKWFELPSGVDFRANFSVDPTRGPLTDFVAAPRGPQPQYWGNGSPYGVHTDLHKAGVGLLVAGGVMTTGAVLAATVTICNKDGATAKNCANDTRTFLAAGFGSAAVALFASGGALVGVAKRRHNLDVAAHASKGRAGVVVSGRF